MSSTKPSSTSGLARETNAPAEVELRSTRDFFRIATFSTALALGCAAASLQALERNATGFAFHVTAGTFVAFVVGATLAVLYWRFGIKNAASTRRNSWWLVLVGAIMFLYPLRFIPSEHAKDMVRGLIVAACWLSALAFVLWQIKRFLDSDTEQSDQAEMPADSTPAPISKKVQRH